MIYKRHYIQFNDLVFDGVEMISEDDPSTGYKYSETEYGFGHGSYSPNKREFPFVRSGSASMTITLRMKRLPCEVRPFYMDFALTQLSRIGKLWAIQNNHIVWAYAKPSNISQSLNSRKDTLEIDVDFFLPEGIWHKADKQKTFLVPYDRCTFMDCYDYHEIQPCISNGCCQCAEAKDMACDCCDCADLEKDMALCYHPDLQSFYDCFESPFRIVYDCVAARKFFGDFYGAEVLGQRFCSDTGVIAGILYSDTVIPTTGVKITLHGKVVNPYIEINGNGNYIVGEYDGILTIYENGEVEFSSDGCHSCEVLPVGAWQVPTGHDYGWVINPGNNRLIIQTGNCCETVCAYIEVDSYTV